MSGDILHPAGVSPVPLDEVLEAIIKVLGEGHEGTAKQVMVAALITLAREAMDAQTHGDTPFAIAQRRQYHMGQVIRASLKQWQEQEEWRLEAPHD